jgi:threonine dehydratase
VAVAYAARRLGVPAKIFVPGICSPAKVDRIRGYGADLVVGGESYAEALAASEAWVRDSEAMSVHAFDQEETLLGQGTLGRELEAQAPELDTVLVGVGGGGLIGGVAAWYAGRVRVVGVEPEAAPTLTCALAAGAPVDAPAGGIAADSLAPRRIGESAPSASSGVLRRGGAGQRREIRAAQRGCGSSSGGGRGPAMPRRSARFSPARCGHRRAGESVSWSAAGTPPQWTSER